MSKAGFLLLEVACFLGILALLLTITIPLYQQLPERIISQELDQLELLCWYLRQAALASSTDLVLLIDTRAKRYRYQLGKQLIEILCDERIVFAAPPGAWGPPANPERLIVQPATFSKKNDWYVVTFSATGVISSGTLYLWIPGTMVGGALTCAVSQVSYIRKYIYTQGQWSAAPAVQ